VRLSSSIFTTERSATVARLRASAGVLTRRIRPAKGDAASLLSGSQRREGSFFRSEPSRERGDDLGQQLGDEPLGKGLVVYAEELVPLDLGLAIDEGIDRHRPVNPFGHHERSCSLLSIYGPARFPVAVAWDRGLQDTGRADPIPPPPISSGWIIAGEERDTTSEFGKRMSPPFG